MSGYAHPAARFGFDPLLAAILSGHATPQQAPSPSSSPAPAKPAEKKPANRSVRAFTPSFDVYETETAYYLTGELPGLSDKRAINIEFSDDRSLLIQGRVERPSFKPTIEPSSPTQTKEEKRRSLNPTVEDTEDEDDFAVVHQKKDEHPKQPQQQPKVEKDPRKVWVSERTFGNFQRSFSFPQPVDIENVTASLNAGLLNITVPKRPSFQPRRVQVL